MLLQVKSLANRGREGASDRLAVVIPAEIEKSRAWNRRDSNTGVFRGVLRAAASLPRRIGRWRSSSSHSI